MTWKRGLTVLAVLVVLGLGASFAVDAVARSAIETTLTRTFGTETSLESVDVGLLSGRVTAEGLVVSHPSEFESPHFASLATTRVRASLGELLGDPVTVDEVVLEDFELYLEQAGGKTNFGPILESSRAAAGEDDGDGRRYRVRTLVIRDVTARARLDPGAGRVVERSVEIPEIRLENLGTGQEGGVTLSRVAEAVVRATVGAVARRSGELPGALGGLLRGAAGSLGDLPGAPDLRLPGSEEGEGLEETVRDLIPGAGGGGRPTKSSSSA